MAEATTPVLSKKRNEKEIRKNIEEKLSLVLSDYKNEAGEKKFDTLIRKTAKTFYKAVVKVKPGKVKKEKGKKRKEKKVGKKKLEKVISS